MKVIVIVLIMIIFAILFHNIVLATSISISVPEKYSEVKAGDRIYFETDIKMPENTERKDLRIEYSMEDERGVEVAYSKVLKAIETQASFMESLNVPESTKEGTYKIYANISDYNGFNEEAVASFRVVSNSPFSSNNFLLILLGFISLIAIIILIELSILMKRKL